MSARLENLDELVIACRSNASKELISEAVICYEGGAVRSAIVATWTAVFFDILDKVRELSVGGDPSASAIVECFEKAEANRDVSALLKFEREVLEIVRRELELLSDFEFQDIRRIQEDRHRCAHPTLDGDGNRFVPAPELARLHIVNAITMLLKQPPVQGKAALEDVVATVTSSLFPTNLEKAINAIRQTGLGNPRASLLRNVLIVFLKKRLRPDKGTFPFNFQIAIIAILEMHRKEAFSIFKIELPRIIRSMDDEELSNVLLFLSYAKELVPLIETDQLNRIKNYVLEMPSDKLDNIDCALRIPELRSEAEMRVNRTTLKEIEECIFFTLPDELVDRLIDLLRHAKSFDDANNICSELRKNLGDLGKDQKESIISIGEDNEQVKHSYEFKNLLVEIDTQTK